ncbi:hypothetical protein GCM10027026_08900 [Myroides odoratimimus subsp. xuanwuensis]
MFLTREALEHGYTQRDLTNARRARHIARVRHGAYTARTTWDASDETDRHLLRAHAVLHSHGSAVALSHTSGALDHGLRAWEPDLQRIHVTRLDGGPARIIGDVVYHAGSWTPDDVLLSASGHLAMTPLRCGLDHAAISSVEQGVVTLDSVVDHGHATTDEILAAHAARERWPGSHRLQLTVRLVRAGAQSLFESRGRHLCWLQHLPEPVLQFEVRDPSGALIGITDMAWPEHGLLAEFDGRVKYGRFLRQGETAADAVVREKVREDRIREATGWLMIRLIWADLYRPEATAARIRRMMRQAACGRTDHTKRSLPT